MEEHRIYSIKHGTWWKKKNASKRQSESNQNNAAFIRGL